MLIPTEWLLWGAGIKESALQNNVLQGSKWASITCIVVSAPVIGRVALVSFERALGTICGGLMGYVLYVWADDITMVTNEVREMHETKR